MHVGGTHKENENIPEENGFFLPQNHQVPITPQWQVSLVSPNFVHGRPDRRLVLCMQPQLLRVRVQSLSCRKDGFTAVLPDLRLYFSVLSPMIWASQMLTYIWTLTYSVYVDHLWVSPLTTIHCEKWSITTVIHDYNNKYLEGGLILCLFKK